MKISLRLEVCQDDAKKMISWLQDKNITQYLNEDIHAAGTLSQIINHHQSDLLTYYLNQDGRFFLIDLDKTCIGFVNLFTIRKMEAYEVVIAIGEEANWGKQYAKKALEAILNEVFFSWRIKRIDAKIYEANTRSISLFEHLHFSLINSHHSLLTYSITFEQYLTLCQSKNSL